MATIDSINEANKRKKEAEKRNPLLKLNLGELVMEMQKIAFVDNAVLLPRDRRNSLALTKENLENIKKYDAIVELINAREQKYLSYKPAPRYGQKS